MTTGERYDGAGHEEVRPSASTACWAALSRGVAFDVLGASRATAEELELVSVGIKQCDANQTRAQLSGFVDRDPQLGRLVLNGCEILHQDREDHRVCGLRRRSMYGEFVRTDQEHSKVVTTIDNLREAETPVKCPKFGHVPSDDRHVVNSLNNVCN